MSDNEGQHEGGLTPSPRQPAKKTSALVKRGIHLAEVLLGHQPLAPIADERSAEAGAHLQQATKHWEKAAASDWHGWDGEGAWICLTESLSAYCHGLAAAAAALNLKSIDTPTGLAARLLREGKLKTDVRATLDWLDGLPGSHSQLDEDSWGGPDTREELLVELETFLDEVDALVWPQAPTAVAAKHGRLVSLSDTPKQEPTAIRHTEQVRDNQWWYTKHPDRDRLDGVVEIALVVEGRRCMMTHSARGRDGRVTRSFRFNLDSDRAAWVGLRGQTVALQLEPAGEVARHFAGAEHLDNVPLLSDAQAERHKAEPATSGHIRRGLLKRTTPTLFDSYLFCDWSANGKPKKGKDSLWSVHGWFDEEGTFLLGPVENHPTRLEAESVIRDRILLHRHAGRRTLVGLDFPFGYPASSLPCLVGNAKAGWRDLWQTLERRVIDGPDNSNNRFVVASELNATVGEHWYWNCPTDKATTTLRSTKDGRGNVAEFRVVEDSLRRAGRRPFTVWQLFGNGSVGSQSLVGLPCCERLRADDSLSLRVWPFETGFTAPARTGSTTASILAEVWPGAVTVDESLHPTKDAAQVLSLVLWAAERDIAGTLVQSFEVPGPFGEDRRRAETVEGWILGWMD